MKKCGRCNKILTENNTTVVHTLGKIWLKSPCTQCYEEGLQKDRDYIRKRNNGKKLEAIKLMGNKCVCCGVSEWWNLTFDHIIPVSKSNKPRIPSNTFTNQIIKDSELRNEFQLLCWGCNMSKMTNKTCQIEH